MTSTLPSPPLGEILWSISCAGNPQLFRQGSEYVLEASVPRRIVHDLMYALEYARVTSVHYEGGNSNTYWQAETLGPNLSISFETSEDVIGQFQRAKTLGCPK